MVNQARPSDYGSRLANTQTHIEWTRDLISNISNIFHHFQDDIACGSKFPVAHSKPVKRSDIMLVFLIRYYVNR